MKRVILGICAYISIAVFIVSCERRNLNEPSVTVLINVSAAKHSSSAFDFGATMAGSAGKSSNYKCETTVSKSGGSIKIVNIETRSVYSQIDFTEGNQYIVSSHAENLPPTVIIRLQTTGDEPLIIYDRDKQKLVASPLLLGNGDKTFAISRRQP